METPAISDRPAEFDWPLMPSMFMRPTYLENSGWLEHIPFAFWLCEAQQPRLVAELGTHHGSSYFAFCQALERLAIGTRCYGIGSWPNNAGMPHDGETAFEKVRAYNDSQYSGFSRLLRVTSDDALARFPDGSVDLLHIDLCHFHDAERRTLEQWIPKLSERSVVLVHHVPGREQSSNSLVEKLLRTSPYFEFVHGNRLVVIGYGPKQHGAVRHLFEASQDDCRRGAVSDVFSRLGRACKDAFAAQEHQARAQTLRQQVEEKVAEMAALRDSLEDTQARLRARRSELSEALARINAEVRQDALERARLSERVSMLQDQRADLKQQVEHLTVRVDQAAVDVNERTETIIKLHVANQELQATLTHLEEKIHRLQRELVEARVVSEQVVEKLQVTESSYASEKAARQSAERARDEARAAAAENAEQLASLRPRLDAAQASILSEISSREAAEREVIQARGYAQRELARLQEQLDVAQAGTVAERASRQSLEAALAKAKANAEQRQKSFLAEKNSLLAQLQDRFEEIARLTTVLMKAETRISDLMDLHGQQAQEIKSLRQHLGRIERARIAAAQMFGRTIMILGGGKPGDRLKPKVLRKLSEAVVSSGLMNPGWYLERHRDVAEAGMDPLTHYLRHGLIEGRDPQDFSEG